MARRWPVLHLANEKSVPFDVAPTRAWVGVTSLYRLLLHPSSPSPSEPPRLPCKLRPLSPFPALRGLDPFPPPPVPRDTFSPSAILPITKGVSVRKLMKLNPRISYSCLFQFAVHNQWLPETWFKLSGPMLKNPAKSFCWEEYMSFFFSWIIYITYRIKRFPFDTFSFRYILASVLSRIINFRARKVTTIRPFCELCMQVESTIVANYDNNNCVNNTLHAMRKREVINRRDNIVTAIVHEREKWRR